MMSTGGFSIDLIFQCDFRFILQNTTLACIKKIFNHVDLLPEPAARGGSGIRHQCSFGVAAELRRRNLIKAIKRVLREQQNVEIVIANPSTRPIARRSSKGFRLRPFGRARLIDA